MRTLRQLGRFVCPVILPFVLLTTAGCGKRSPAAVLPADARTFAMRGRVVEISPARDTVTIEHEEVADFMPAMTMPFALREPALLAASKPGDAVAFRFVVTDRESWIDRLEKVDAASLHLAAAKPPVRNSEAPARARDRLREGDRLPDFTLTDQDGRAITREDFAGGPLVLTFIFTRCPVPDFCPRLTNHFAELQRRLGEVHAPGTKLLSISFDPEFDRQPVLKAYAEAHGAKTGVWSVATGDAETVQKLTAAFAVRLQPENGTISHGLCTALVGADGIIRVLWRGNGWSPDEVLVKLGAEAANERRVVLRSQ